MSEASLRNRLLMATQMWRQATSDPLPKVPPGQPAEQITAFEIKVVELLEAKATPDNARETADKTWDLVHDRPDGDPVKRKVIELHEALARLSAR